MAGSKADGAELEVSEQGWRTGRKCSTKSEANEWNHLWQGETHVTRQWDLEKDCLEHPQNESMAWPL